MAAAATIADLAVTRVLDPYLTLRALAEYSGICVRKLRDLISDPFNPLPHYRIGGKLLVRVSEFDAWARQHRHAGVADIERIASEAVREVREAARAAARR